MAAIQCPGCKAYLSISGAKTCPLCGTALPAVAAASAPSSPPPAAAAKAYEASPQSMVGPVIGMLAALLIFGVIASVVYRMAVPSQEKIREQALSNALITCQHAIQSTAQYGGAEMPPYVPNSSRAQTDEFYFAWPTGSFEFTNGFGAKLKMSASCIGTLWTGKITALTVNGKDVI